MGLSVHGLMSPWVHEPMGHGPMGPYGPFIFGPLSPLLGPGPFIWACPQIVVVSDIQIVPSDRASAATAFFLSDRSGLCISSTRSTPRGDAQSSKGEGKGKPGTRDSDAPKGKGKGKPGTRDSDADKGKGSKGGKKGGKDDKGKGKDDKGKGGWSVPAHLRPRPGPYGDGIVQPKNW